MNGFAPMGIKLYAAIGIGGAFGASARYGMSVLFPAASPAAWPWATLICNISGSFLLGLIFAAAVRYGLSNLVREALGTGVIGAYTTFSAFSLETLHMLQEGLVAKAFGYVIVSTVLSVAAAAAGPYLLPVRREGQGL